MDSSVKDGVETITNNNRPSVFTNISDEIFHDFKNILANISGLAQLSIIKTESEEIKHNLYEINQATFDIRDKLTRFYNYSNEFYDEVEQIESIFKILNRALKLVNYKFNNPNVYGKTIVLRTTIASNANVVCNDVKMLQSFLNIIMNAIDSMEENGGILTINLYEDEGKVVLEIKDTGIGMSSETMKKVSNKKFTTKRNGSGLGLRIAMSNIENASGNLHIDSTEGVGTTVKISLPIYR